MTAALAGAIVDCHTYINAKTWGFLSKFNTFIHPAPSTGSAKMNHSFFDCSISVYQAGDEAADRNRVLTPSMGRHCQFFTSTDQYISG